MSDLPHIGIYPTASAAIPDLGGVYLVPGASALTNGTAHVTGRGSAMIGVPPPVYSTSVPEIHFHPENHEQPLATIDVLTMLIVAAVVVAIVVRALAWTLRFVGQSWPPVDGLSPG